MQKYTILDCGDIPISPMDNELALRQMTEAFAELGGRKTAVKGDVGFPRPKIVTLGGDHSIALAALRGLTRSIGGPVAVLHFDAHLDTWHPARYMGAWPSEQAKFNHGSMFWMASEEGLIINGSSVHAGLRTRLGGLQDLVDDDRQGFLRISADDIDDIGTKGVIEKIMERMGEEMPVYLSLDIDVLDPGLCPGTGTPEPGGWTSREVIRILRGLERLNIVGADVVEVAPAYDGVGEQTSLVAAQVVYEIITSMVLKGMRYSKGDGLKSEL
jgi:agmatinase